MGPVKFPGAPDPRIGSDSAERLEETTGARDLKGPPPIHGGLERAAAGFDRFRSADLGLSLAQPAAAAGTRTGLQAALEKLGLVSYGRVDGSFHADFSNGCYNPAIHALPGPKPDAAPTAVSLSGGFPHLNIAGEPFAGARAALRELAQRSASAAGAIDWGVAVDSHAASGDPLA